MNSTASTRSSLAQGFTPFNYSSAKHAINFAYGLPDPAMFSELAWPDALSQNTGVATADLLQYTDAVGLPKLRTRLAQRYNVQHEEVILTAGASQALQLIGDVLLDPGDIVITEDPSYLGALRIFSITGATILQLGMNADGVDLSALETTLRREPRVKLFYTAPAFHNPTGRQISRAHMARVAGMLARHGVALVQDLVYSELPYNGLDDWLPPGGNVINVHSISKIAGPGLRVGWVLADSDIINRLARLKCDGGVSPIVSNIVLSLLQSSTLDAHIVRLRQHYRTKRDSLHTLLQRSRFCAPEYLLPSGGFSFWVRLAGGIEAETFIEAARREHDVHLVHGRHYGPRSGHHVRLCFSYLPTNVLEEGLARLDKLQAKLHGRSLRTLAENGRLEL
ncbi:PLP-dependent aminotransferase family protein [Bradyrhizobium arachidis]|uniref:aminotransferase-like domain-containing protein n=1 Tax=Bradyrhizobium arachidis TaxID=858423 RepID=UPI00216111FD|nr:PLP-dependent aminotransferase family protein [Bradyrhizobium arachidis]UVO30495.1 PLP-dependent aminotransferase family protein [Bradyrhizobium arachidis]